MEKIYTIEVDRYNPTSLAYCLKKLENIIPDYEYEWMIRVNAGGIDYGVFLNINIEEEEIEICNQPRKNDIDFLEDVVEVFEMENKEK